MREVHFYRTRSGDCPVEEFLDALTGKQAQKVVWVLRLVEELDPVPSQYFKKLVDTDGLWEVRAQHGGDTFRLIGFFDGSRFLVVSGFSKKTEKTPRQELEVGEARRQDYLSRRKCNERSD
ncbi:MAG TPA: type II toxin-antitoxin system RelE/ParE family toxin [Thermoanaerobaculia bacterium]|nr:type II toxin-antitoxin system RelE/ParE family toxin [Thermoanaerobaculia bacterium]